MKKSCSPLSNRVISDDELFIDDTINNEITITHAQTAITGTPTCVNLSLVKRKVAIANRTGVNIPICSGGYYIDLEGNAKNYLPAISTTTISYSSEQYWQQIANDGGTSTEIPNTKTDTPAITINLSGTLNRDIQAQLRLDSDPNNAAQITSEGLFVAPGDADVPNTKEDTPAITVNLSGTLNRNIEAELNLSGDVGNAAEIRAGGLYVPESTGGGGAFTGDV